MKIEVDVMASTKHRLQVIGHKCRSLTALLRNNLSLSYHYVTKIVAVPSFGKMWRLSKDQQRTWGRQAYQDLMLENLSINRSHDAEVSGTKVNPHRYTCTVEPRVTTTLLIQQPWYQDHNLSTQMYETLVILSIWRSCWYNHLVIMKTILWPNSVCINRVTV